MADEIGDTGGADAIKIAQWLIRRTDADKVFIDCGAHIGAVGIPVALKTSPHLAIFVEPDSRAFKVLEQNVKEANLKNYLLINKAIADKTGTVTLNLGTLAAHSSLVIGKDKKQIEVEAITIDDIIEAYAEKRRVVIKMDIEAAEPLAWQGMQKHLDQIDAMAMEYMAEYIPNAGEFYAEVRHKFLMQFITGNNLDHKCDLGFIKP